MIPILNWFGFGVGLAVAALLFPVAAHAGLENELLFFTVGVTGLFAWVIATRAEGIQHRIARHPLGTWLMLVPLVVAWGYSMLQRWNVLTVSQDLVLATMLVGVVGTVIAVVAAGHHYALDATSGLEPLAQWKAGPDRSRGRLFLLTGVMLLLSPLILLIAWVASIELPSPPVLEWIDIINLPFIMGILLIVNGRRSTDYALYQSGLRRKPAGAIASTLLPADRISSYEVTDDVLVIRLQEWWLLPIRCDRSEISDIGVISDAFDRLLE